MSNTIHDKLMKIQSELHAPKNQYNNFGKYHYRSCEDILEGVKPLLKKYDVTLILSDKIINVGERYYIEATAEVMDSDGATALTRAYAREAETKKGMDEAQITGSASSYARKYALNGLFCIDDTKDADATNTHGAGTEKKETPKHSTPQAETQPFITEAQRKKLYAMTKAVNMTSQEAQDFLKNYGFSNSKEVTKDKFKDIVKELENMQGSDPSDAEMKAYADWSERIPEDEEAQKQFLDASRKRLFAFMKEQGMEGEDAKKYVKNALGVDMSTNDILVDPELRRKLNIKVYNDTGEVLFG